MKSKCVLFLILLLTLLNSSSCKFFQPKLIGKWKSNEIGLEVVFTSDSTYSLNYQLHAGGYSTCGFYKETKKEIILEDLQDRNAIIYDIDCKNYTRRLYDTTQTFPWTLDTLTFFGKMAIKKNNQSIFDSTNKLILKKKKRKLVLNWEWERGEINMIKQD